MTDLLHSDKTERIIKAFYSVYNALGFGFLEKVYENALAHELRKEGFEVKCQYPVKIHYKGIIVGEYCADMIVDSEVIIEIKSVELLINAHRNQTINYLKASEIEVGLLMNFGAKPIFERFLFTNDKKPLLKQV